jgi:HAD superfamily hydrolase (TIGR01459 family)
MLNEPAAIGATRLVSGLRDLANSYDAILCDVWGVVHDGQAAFAPACEALARFRQKGGRVALVTNAPRPRRPIFAQLAQLGVPREAFDVLVTSGDVTLSFMAERQNAPVFHIGPDRDLALFEALREEMGFRPPRVRLSEADYVLCTGLNRDDIETPDDYATQLSDMRARSLDFVCANPDLVVHVGDRLIFCAGALAASYEGMGGRVLQAGKPHSPIYDRALSEIAALREAPVDRSRTLAIGDAMRTDIRGACDAGLDALFITSGIHREELHPTGGKNRNDTLDHSAFEQFLDAADRRPTAALAKLIW